MSGPEPEGPTVIEAPLISVPPHEAAQVDDLVEGMLARAFDGDPARVGELLTALRPALPEGTVVALRGSAVVGRSFKTGSPFDSAGPGTSDLDLVVIGDAVQAMWDADAQLLGGINTLPLSDTATWVAPALEHARRRAQAIARRPVSIQAMTRWFLDARSRIQGQPYVILGEVR
jgi:hypothetical protein